MNHRREHDTSDEVWRRSVGTKQTDRKNRRADEKLPLQHHGRATAISRKAHDVGRTRAADANKPPPGSVGRVAGFLREMLGAAGDGRESLRGSKHFCRSLTGRATRSSDCPSQCRLNLQPPSCANSWSAAPDKWWSPRRRPRRRSTRNQCRSDGSRLPSR